MVMGHTEHALLSGEPKPRQTQEPWALTESKVYQQPTVTPGEVRPIDNLKIRACLVFRLYGSWIPTLDGIFSGKVSQSPRKNPWLLLPNWRHSFPEHCVAGRVPLLAHVMLPFLRKKPHFYFL